MNTGLNQSPADHLIKDIFCKGRRVNIQARFERKLIFVKFEVELEKTSVVKSEWGDPSWRKYNFGISK